MFWAVIELLLENFGETIDAAAFDGVVRRIVQVGASDEFLAHATAILVRLPPTESVILLIHGAAVVRNAASQGVFAEFVDLVRSHIAAVGPMLASFCTAALGLE
jgi:hypothetical protein